MYAHFANQSRLKEGSLWAEVGRVMKLDLMPILIDISLEAQVSDNVELDSFRTVKRRLHVKLKPKQNQNTTKTILKLF